MPVPKRPFPVYAPGSTIIPLIVLAIVFAAAFLLPTVSREQSAAVPGRTAPATAGVSIVTAQLAASLKPLGPLAGPLAGRPAAALAARPADPATRARVSVVYSRLPLEFEANRGQTAKKVKFLCRTGAGPVFLTGNEMVLCLRDGGRRTKDEGRSRPASSILPSSHSPPLRKSADLRVSAVGFPSVLRPPSSVRASVVNLRLAGANPDVDVTGEEPLPGKSNYFIGNDPSKWRTNVPHYAKVRCRNVYPGIDVVYYGSQRQIEHDFVVKPGADPSSITLEVTGAAGKLSVDSDGGLQIPTAAGRVTLEKPAVYQEEGGVHHAVQGRYRVTRTGRRERVQFEIAQYDRRQELVIDPVLAYSTYLGGSFDDQGTGIAVDATGAAYVTGYTGSANFPTASPIQATYGSGGYDAFVSKISPDGAQLIYSTFLGGSRDDYGRGIAVDGAGAAYVTGQTTSANFPTASSLPSGYGGGNDAFVSKISPDGSQLVYSTYLGGSSDDYGHGIAVDIAGAAYVTGYTSSTDFPTVSALQAALKGAQDAFVSKISTDGSYLVYSTYLGGNYSDYGYGIAVDGTGAAYVTGQTGSADFPTASPLQAVFGGIDDAFVSKINADGSRLVYSTFLGGSGDDEGDGIAVDGTGTTCVTGTTTSTDFPTASPLQARYGGSDYDAFVSKISADGSQLVYSTYLGGSGVEYSGGIAVDDAGAAYVTGSTSSVDFPTVSPLQAHSGIGDYDAFISKIRPDGVQLVYSTYLGGENGDGGTGIAVDGTGAAYVTGGTDSSNFPTASPLQPAPGGYSDAFVAKIRTPPVVLSFNPTSGPVGTSVDITGSVFTGATAVAFNGTNAGFTVHSDTLITAAVPAGAATGPISVTGPGGTGTSAQSFTVIYPPPAPTTLTASPVNAQITLTWTAANGAASYNIKRSTTSGAETTINTGVTITSYADTGLTNGTTYFYVVTASNPAGESASSNEASATPLAAPNAPTLLTADAGSGQVTLTWTAPATDSTHGPRATYNIKRSTTTGAETTVQTDLTSTSYTDTGLTNGTKYFYVVTASNVGGESSVSNEASATPVAAPTDLTASPGSAQVALTWTASSGAATYNIERGSASGTEVIIKTGVTDTSYTDVGLTNGTTYYYVVTAANVSGESPVSNEASATPLAAPAAPTGLTTFPGDAQVNLTWTAPATDPAHGPPATYNIERSTTAGAETNIKTGVSTTGYTDTTVTNGTKYYYVVTASNVGGESAISNEASAAPLAAPAAPTGLMASPGDAQISLSWTAPATDTTHGPTTTYNIKRSTTTGVETTVQIGVTGTDYTDTTVANGTTYYYVVTAANVGGESPVSNEVSAIPLAAPAAPTGLAASPGNTQVMLTWSASATASGYNIERGTTAGGEVTVKTGATTANYTDTGLTNGTNYFYVVTAVNVGGESPVSNEVNATPLAAPAPPTGLAASPANAQVVLSWTAPAADGTHAPAATYNIERSTTTGAESTIKSGLTTTSYTDSGVTNGTKYFYVVTANNAGGESSVSNEANATPLAAPGVPTGLAASPGNRQIVLAWTAPATDRAHGPVATYNIKRSTSAGAETILQKGVTGTSYTDTGLTNGTKYFYVVTAANAGGESTVSLEVSAAPLATPAAPIGLTASYGNVRVSLTWTAPATDATHGPTAAYNIKRSTTPGAETTIKTGVPTTSYTDTTVTNGTKYYYVVTASGVGGESPVSNEVNAVPAASTTVTLTASPAAAAYGQKITLTAVVSTASGAPTGSITFQDGASSLGKVDLSNGMAALSTTSLTVGTHSLTAVYSGDSGFAGSTSAPATVAITYQYPTGVSMVSVPYDYSTQGTDAAVLFGLSSSVGPAPIAIYDPAKSAYDFYPTLLDGGKQTRPGRAYWVLESSAQPSPAPGDLVASPFTESLSPGWNMIGDPFPSALDGSTLQLTAVVSVGSVAAGTPISETDAVTAGLIVGPLWTYDTSSKQYQQTTMLQPYSGCWIYIDPTVSGGQPVALTFTHSGT